MRAVVQRVTAASVTVDGEVVGAIDAGLVVFAAVGEGDGEADLRWIADKVVNLRVFNDAEGKFDRTVADVGGGILAVSQFTLYGDCRKGRRPSFSHAAPPDDARARFNEFVGYLRESGLTVATGVFQAMMTVDVANDGPVTLLLDSAKSF